MFAYGDSQHKSTITGFETLQNAVDTAIQHFLKGDWITETTKNSQVTLWQVEGNNWKAVGYVKTYVNPITGVITIKAFK